MVVGGGGDGEEEQRGSGSPRTMARERWRRSIEQQIMLLRMEKENQSILSMTTEHTTYIVHVLCRGSGSSCGAKNCYSAEVPADFLETAVDICFFWHHMFDCSCILGHTCTCKLTPSTNISEKPSPCTKYHVHARTCVCIRVLASFPGSSPLHAIHANTQHYEFKGHML